MIRFFGPLNAYMYSCKKLDGFVWKLENLVNPQKNGINDSSIQKDTAGIVLSKTRGAWENELATS